MDYATLCAKAKELHKAASHPAMQDILYANTIRAEWDDRAETFTSLSIRAMKSHRTTPMLSKRFTLRFLPGDPTDELSVHKLVAHRFARIDVTRKKPRRAKIGGD